MARILLTHPPDMRRSYYGERALAGLKALGDVILHQGQQPLGGEALAAAARDARIIVADRNTPGPRAVFDRSPQLMAFVRCAVDIRNIDVAAASEHGVLVTRASAGFVPAVTELVVGFMVDLSRGGSRAVADYRAGRTPSAGMGRQLAGSTLGGIGYGAIGRRGAAMGGALGVRVRVHHPPSPGAAPGIGPRGFGRRLANAR